MKLHEIDALLEETRKELEPLEVPEEERLQTIKELEVGKYPADQPDTYLKSGRTEFDRLKTERIPLTEQVQKARTQEQTFRDQESITGRIKQFGQELLAPHEVVQPKTPAVAPLAGPSPVPPTPRFQFDDGEIIDTKRGQIITTDLFNRSSTSQEKAEFEQHMRQSGLLVEGPEDVPSQVPPSQVSPSQVPTPGEIPLPQPTAAPLAKDPRTGLDIDPRTGRPIPVLKNEPVNRFGIERVPQIVQEQGNAGVTNAIESLATTLRHFQANPGQVSPLNALAMKVREYTGYTPKLDLVTPFADLLSSVSNALRSSKDPITPESVPELVAAGVTRFMTETVPELTVLRAMTGNMALAFGAHGLIKGSMFEDETGRPVFHGLNMHGAMSGLINLATVGILHGLAPTSRMVRAGVGATIGGGVTAAQGGSPEQIVADAVTFAAMAGMAPGNPEFMRLWGSEWNKKTPGQADPRVVNPQGLPGPGGGRVPTPDEVVSGPARTSPSVATSPFAEPPPPKPPRQTPPVMPGPPRQPAVDPLSAIPNELQIRQGPPQLFKQPPLSAGTQDIPQIIPQTAQPVEPTAITPDILPDTNQPLPPASAPEMVQSVPTTTASQGPPEEMVPGAALTDQSVIEEPPAPVPTPETVMAQPEPIVATWDTMKRGDQVTLHRGENEQNAEGGQWWTTNKGKAALYGNVSSVTLPAEVVAKNAAQGHGGPDEFVFPGKRPEELSQGAAVLPQAAEEPVLEVPEVEVRATPLEPETPSVTVEDIHALADAKGIPWDNDENFMAFTKELVGKTHLDDMDPLELMELQRALDRVKPFELKKKEQQKARPHQMPTPEVAPTDWVSSFGQAKEPRDAQVKTKYGLSVNLVRRFKGAYDLVTDDGAKIGDIHYRPSADETGYVVAGVAIDPAFQRQGVARAVYDFLEREVIKQPFQRAGSQSIEGKAFRDERDRVARKTELPAPVTPTDVAAHAAATSPLNAIPQPTQPMKEAMNYKMGHVSIAGLDISIENPAGSTRSGVSKSGKAWSSTLKDHYGYIRGTKGKDKEHLDVFVKPGTPEDYSGPVFVVDQQDPTTKRFDEHKVILGASTAKEARTLYQQNYAKDWNGLASLSTFSMPQFKAWLKSADSHTQPAAAYNAPKEKPTVTPESVVTKPQPVPTPEQVVKTPAIEILPTFEAAQVPRSQLVPEQNAEMLARAEKAQADLEIAGSERGGRYFQETQGQGSTQDVTGLKSATADWYKDATTGPMKLSKQRVDVAVQKIIADKGRDVGKDVQRIKELLLQDQEFNSSPFAPKTEEDWKALIELATAKRARPGETPETAVKAGQQEIAVPPPTIGERPLIGREATPEEAPLFSKAAQEPDVEQTSLPEQNDKTAASIKLADDVADILKAGNKIGTELFDRADTYFGGTQAQGAYTPKDAFDALELGINKYILERGNIGVFDPRADSVKSARDLVNGIRKFILDKIPAQQNRRTAEMDEFQQFSTPPDLAFVMNWVANIAGERAPSSIREHDADVVLEPSAGLGGLAVFAKNAGATVYVNELSDRRAALLKSLDFDGVTTEKAEQLHNILPAKIKPTVIVMNPPFSSTAGRMDGQRKSANVVPHLDQALKRLAPGGRLVALIGKGKEAFGGETSKAVEAWIAEPGKTLRARIGLSGKGFKKYGTTFDNQLLIFDKGGAIEEMRPVIANVDDVLDAIPLLKEVRDARIYSTPAESTTGRGLKPTADQPGSQAVATPGEVTDRGQQSVPTPTDLVGPRPTRGQVATGDRPPRQPGTSRPGDAVVPTQASAIGTPDERGQRGQRKQPVSEPSGQPAQPTGRSVASGASVGSGTHGGSGAVPAERTDSISIEQAEQAAPFEKADLSSDGIYEVYRPQKLKVAGAQAHPGELVQSAAMAAVDPPDATYQPKIPKAIITEGKLSIAQLEPIVAAGQAHTQTLPNGQRKGYFIGDGTGVGKGREISGIILDNFNHGRTKALWISKSAGLITDAKRDWSGIDQDPAKIFDLKGVKVADPVQNKQGILFSTYNTLIQGLVADRGGNLVAAKNKKTDQLKEARLDQIVKWLGPEFDGVIAFDESHAMANASPTAGARGPKDASSTGLVGLELQKRLPKARIVYVSATGATEVANFAYAERLGLWGEGTSFPNRDSFIGKMQEGGLAAMEVVSQNMKAMGLYVSRQLSFRGVTYDRLEHKLTPAQIEIYDAMARAWQLVYQNIGAALEETGGNKNKNAKGAAKGKFMSAQQRFFNQVLTSMQMPSVIESVKKQLADGHSVVLQLVNTNEAGQTREMEKQAEQGGELEDVDLTPKELLMTYVEKAFPTQQYEQFLDDNGKKQMRPVFDSNGVPVQNAEAVAMKEALLNELGSMKVPDGALEFILDTFGEKMVAEVTGRQERLIRVKDEEGRVERIAQKGRTQKVRQADAKQFMDDKKQVLVFSDAGGTGMSYHADRTTKNQRKRIHYLVQPGWRADNAVQGFGRTHRANQVQPPHYILATTDLKGHKRFISSVARRLDQLGALTKGQRQTGTQGFFNEEDNLEGLYANAAVKALLRDIQSGQVPGMDWAGLVEKRMAFDNLIDQQDGKLSDEKMPKVPQFLNRILALEYTEQNAVFEEFNKRMKKGIEIAASHGQLDVGLENYKADGVTLKSEQTVYTQPGTNAQTKLLDFEAQHKVDFTPFTDAQKMLKSVGFYKSQKTGKVFVAIKPGTTHTTEQGEVREDIVLRSPVHGKNSYITTNTLESSYDKLKVDEARPLWDQTITTTDPYSKETVHLLSGVLLPIWDRLPSGFVRILRMTTDDGRRFIGRRIQPDALDATKKKLGADVDAKNYTPESALEELEEAGQGSKIVLANGWTISPVRVAGDERYELKGEGLHQARPELEKAGAFMERIQFDTRWFIPTDTAATVLKALTKFRPILEVLKKGAQILGEQRGSIPLSGLPKFGKEAREYRKMRAAEELRGFSSSDEDIETRVRAAKQGVKPEGIWARLKDHGTEVWHLVSREFKDLPDTAEFAPLRTSLLQLAKYKGIAADQVQRDLAAIIKPLSRKQYDQFEWKALLSDLAREAEAERTLPFGYTKEKVQDDLDRLNQVIERDPIVQAAWTKRQALWAKHKEAYQTAMDTIGFDTSKKLTKIDYFRHQVLEYARVRALSGTGSKVRTPTGRGFLRTRHGSGMDINANYVQAEFEVMAQMVYDTQVAKVVAGVDRTLNIRKSLEEEAKVRNADSLQRIIDEGGIRGAIVATTLKDFRNRIGMHMGMARKALDLPKGERITLSQLAEIADDSESPANLSARGVFKAISERKAYTKDLLGRSFKTWEDLVPDTHDVWQPREGNVFYMADSIPAQLAKALQEGMLEEVGLTANKLRKVMAMGNLHEQYVIPVEAKATLEELSQKPQNWFVDMNRSLLSHWKQLMLIAPRKVLRYNVRNLTGDSDAMFVGNPHAFLKLRQAAKELIPVIFKDTVLTGEAKEWSNRGGYGSTLQMQELGDINDLKAFKHSLDRAAGGWLKAPASVWNAYWKTARLSTDYRESLMRYAAYLDYLEQMQASPTGRPKNFGASIPNTVMALPDLRDRAFKMSNELLGAYDRVSVAGQTLRAFWIPFWSWQEVNATRYTRLVRNAFEGEDAGSKARAAFLGTKKAASFLIKLALFWSGLQAWNLLMFGDDEDELRETNPTVANRPHILFGRDDKGKILYLAGIGALGDLLAWFGLDAAPGMVGDVMHDRLTIGEAVKNAAKAPVNKLWQGLTPTVKMPLEIAVRETTYPDVFQPRAIQDRGDYLANQFTIGPEVAALRGKPGKTLFGGEDLTGLLVQRTDPKSAAYGTWQGIEKKYLNRMGKDAPAIFWRTPRGEALSNWSRAIQQEDAQAETRWKNEYERMEREKYGYKFSQTKMMADIEKSLRARAPLAGVTKAERDEIVKQLDSQERRTLERAEEYYTETLLKVLPEARRRTFTTKLQRQKWLTRPSESFAPHELTQ